MSLPKDHIAVVHGKLTISVPRDLFNEDGTIADPDAKERFCSMLRKRYPWLSENATAVLMRNAVSTFISTIDEETCGRSMARRMISEGRLDEAIDHLNEHLSNDPDNADTLYLLGETLCMAGRTKEGYAVLNKGRRTSR